MDYGKANARYVFSDIYIVLVDLSKPVPGEVVDGLAEDFTDVQFTTSQTKVELQWRNFFDPESNISHYDVKVYRAKFAFLWLYDYFFLSYFDS